MGSQEAAIPAAGPILRAADRWPAAVRRPVAAPWRAAAGEGAQAAAQTAAAEVHR